MSEAAKGSNLVERRGDHGGDGEGKTRQSDTLLGSKRLEEAHLSIGRVGFASVAAANFWSGRRAHTFDSMLHSSRACRTCKNLQLRPYLTLTEFEIVGLGERRLRSIKSTIIHLRGLDAEHGPASAFARAPSGMPMA